jgi:hypothetical protein
MFGRIFFAALFSFTSSETSSFVRAPHVAFRGGSRTAAAVSPGTTGAGASFLPSATSSLPLKTAAAPVDVAAHTSNDTSTLYDAGEVVLRDPGQVRRRNTERNEM